MNKSTHTHIQKQPHIHTFLFIIWAQIQRLPNIFLYFIKSLKKRRNFNYFLHFVFIQINLFFTFILLKTLFSSCFIAFWTIFFYSQNVWPAWVKLEVRPDISYKNLSGEFTGKNLYENLFSPHRSLELANHLWPLWNFEFQNTV